MGALCAKVEMNEISEELTIPDLEFDTFHGKNDSYFRPFEKQANFFSYLMLHEYVQILYSFSGDTDKKENKSYMNELSETKFPVFLNKKLLQHPLVSEAANKNEDGFDIFNTISNYLFKYVYKNYKSEHHKIYGRKLTQKEKLIPKICLLPFGFLYCSNTPNRTKIHFMFNLLNKKGRLARTEDLSIFVYSMLVIPSNVSIVSINDVCKENEDLRKNMPIEKFFQLYEQYEVKDCIVLTGRWIEDVFAGEESLVYSAFERNIMEKRLYWIFTPTGIRYTLEEFHKGCKKNETMEA